jgi:hypothetical protein
MTSGTSRSSDETSAVPTEPTVESIRPYAASFVVPAIRARTSAAPSGPDDGPPEAGAER